MLPSSPPRTTLSEDSHASHASAATNDSVDRTARILLDMLYSSPSASSDESSYIQSSYIQPPYLQSSYIQTPHNSAAKRKASSLMAPSAKLKTSASASRPLILPPTLTIAMNATSKGLASAMTKSNATKSKTLDPQNLSAKPSQMPHTSAALLPLWQISSSSGKSSAVVASSVLAGMIASDGDDDEHDEDDNAEAHVGDGHDNERKVGNDGRQGNLQFINSDPDTGDESDTVMISAAIFPHGQIIQGSHLQQNQQQNQLPSNPSLAGLQSLHMKTSPPSDPHLRKRDRVCSVCKKVGHNARTCRSHAVLSLAR